MARAANSLIWGIALFVGAIVLAVKDTDPLPWAIAATGVVVVAPAGIVMFDEQSKTKAGS